MNKRIDNATMAGIFLGLCALSIGIIFSYPSLPQWSIYIAIPSIILMFILLLIISPIPEIIKKKIDIWNRNNLAIKYFKKFDEQRFAYKFQKILSKDSDSYYYEHTIQTAIKKLKDDYKQFDSIPVPQIKSIRDHFNFWLKLYTYFNKKIDYDNLSIMLYDFSIMVNEYHDICISGPIQDIFDTTIKSGLRIETIKRYLDTAEGNYDDFEKMYNQCIEQINGEFVDKIPSISPIKRL